MDEPTKTKIYGILRRPVVQITVAEAIWLALTIDKDDELHDHELEKMAHFVAFERD